MNDGITLHTIVPANPGWAIVQFVGGADDDSNHLWYDPIIAWDIDRNQGDHIVVPLTTEGGVNMNYAGLRAFKRPDGTFETFDGGRCKTEADLIETFKAIQEEERAAAMEKQS